ncbi:hypothetical protein MMC28_000309 [Mycoblastus sanguinarius]|nr:hypothetical protein [Mycoblastus sanguinarius]
MAQADIKAHRMKRDTDLQDESSESSTARKRLRKKGWKILKEEIKRRDRDEKYDKFGNRAGLAIVRELSEDHGFVSRSELYTLIEVCDPEVPYGKEVSRDVSAINWHDKLKYLNLLLNKFLKNMDGKKWLKRDQFDSARKWKICQDFNESTCTFNDKVYINLVQA